MIKKLIRSFTKDEFTVETMRGSGPGGQKRNKTDSCVRITHKESGICAYNCETKSQHQNKKKAFEELAARLMEHFYPKSNEDRRQQASFGADIRSYKEPDQRVKDESGIQLSFDDVVYGDGLDKIIQNRALKNQLKPLSYTIFCWHNDVGRVDHSIHMIW